MMKNRGEFAPLVVVGYDFRHASASWRSKIVLCAEEENELSEKLEDAGVAGGLVVLNTCNRNEWIASTSTPDWTGQLMRARMMTILKKKTGQNEVPEPYVYHGEEAVRHILRTASGLESFVVGERQIAGQISKAFQKAQEDKRSSVILNGLQPILGRAAREALKLGVGDGNVRGVHDAAVRYLMSRHPADKPLSLLVLGFGVIGRLLAQSVNARTPWRVTPLNRTIPQRNKNAIQPLSALPKLIEKADMIAVCTGAFSPVLKAEQITPRTKENPLTIVDIGIPVQTELAVGDIEGVRFLSLDELQETDVVKMESGEKLEKMEAIIDEYTVEFIRFCNERELVKVLQTTQSLHERYVHEVIPGMIEEEFPMLGENERARLAFRLRGMIREYTNNIFNSIHEVSSGETKWHNTKRNGSQ